MKKILSTTLFFAAIVSFSQTSNFSFDWTIIKNNDELPQMEASWINENLSDSDIKEVFNLVSDLSKPSAGQLLVSYFYLDGSFSRKVIKPYLDSLAVRPPDGDAGIIRLAYLVSKLRKELNEIANSSQVYSAEFKENVLTIPEFNEIDINKNIELSFDYEPAKVTLDILSEPDITNHEILSRLRLPQFDELIKHRSQSFYFAPINKERLAICLEIAASTKPLDKLYKYMNPYGLLNFADVKSNLKKYNQQIDSLLAYEQSIFDYTNSKIAPYLPSNTKFKRTVSFFFASGADGWATSNVVGIDLNYYKDDFSKLIRLLVHESYHGGQNAVSINDSVQREEKVQFFVDVLNYVFSEGTATYIAPPMVLSDKERDDKIEKGNQLLVEVYENTIINYNEDKSQQLVNEGVAGAGPFYWLGAEMSRMIINELGKEKLASIIPVGGVAFIKLFLDAINKSELKKIHFSESFIDFIQNLK